MKFQNFNPSELKTRSSTENFMEIWDNNFVENFTEIWDNNFTVGNGRVDSLKLTKETT